MKNRILFTLAFTLLFCTTNSQKQLKKHEFDLSAVNYEIIGEGRPILMLHGMSVDLRVMKNAFEPIFADLSKVWKRIYLDLPGMGKTAAFDWIKSSDEMLIFLSEFIDKVIQNEEFVVAGYSYGGYLARGLISNPEVNTIGGIFVCPLIIPDDKKRNVPGKMFYNRDSSIYNSLDLNTKTMINYFLVNQNSVTINRFYSDILTGYQIANRGFIDRIRNNTKKYSFSKKVTKNFNTFEKPTIFIVAKQDILVGFCDAQAIMSYFPNSTFIAIDSAGHAVQIDAPHKFESQIKTYLNSL